MPRLMTDWLCVGVSGKTVDGRNIDPQWLIDAAETYDRQTYTALIWPRHHENTEERSWSFNYGEVDALKYERDGDKVKLYARLMPNDWLIDTNKRGQKLFTSIEVLPNFAGTGRSYLTGLSVTDLPASTGTDRMMFSAQSNQSPVTMGSVEAFSLGDLVEGGATQANEHTGLSFLQRVFQRRTGHEKQGEEMTKEHFDQLMAGQQAQTEALQALAQGLQQFSVQAAPAAEKQEPEKAEAAKDTPSAVTAEQFSQQAEALKDLDAKIGKVLQVFEQMGKTPATVTPGMNPGESGQPQVFL